MEGDTAMSMTWTKEGRNNRLNQKQTKKPKKQEIRISVTTTKTKEIEC